MDYNKQIGLEARKLLTRRWFFKECGIGLGSLALASLMEESLFAQSQSAIRNHESSCAQAAAFQTESQARDLSLYGRRAFAVRDLRLQTVARQIQRQARPAGVRQRPQLRVHQAGRGLVRFGTEIFAVWAIGGVGVRGAALHGAGRR